FLNTISWGDFVIEIQIANPLNVIDDRTRVIQLMDAVQQRLPSREGLQYVARIAVLGLQPVDEFRIRTILHPTVRILQRDSKIGILDVTSRSRRRFLRGPRQNKRKWEQKNQSE